MRVSPGTWAICVFSNLDPSMPQSNHWCYASFFPFVVLQGPLILVNAVRAGHPVLFESSPITPSLFPIRFAIDQTEEQMRQRGTSWREERERLEKVGLVAVWLPISEGDVGLQVSRHATG